eukprot:TRINITY_DN3151_c0_g1_i1.p1 TRINITY_DN3151_c0_g1~~TRINITY_DN3151_c0_g1_i1.p1  ORF type:complete len:89 (-),score=5.42 TRINITY_DN3151_c0_g1_i1:76-342(-)
MWPTEDQPASLPKILEVKPLKGQQAPTTVERQFREHGLQQSMTFRILLLILKGMEFMPLSDYTPAKERGKGANQLLNLNKTKPVVVRY